MHYQKKLGIGFILFGLVVVIIAYAASTHQGAFAFAALIGLMAICFGAFQIMLSNLAVQAKATPRPQGTKSTKLKKARR